MPYKQSSIFFAGHDCIVPEPAVATGYEPGIITGYEPNFGLPLDRAALLPPDPVNTIVSISHTDAAWLARNSRSTIGLGPILPSGHDGEHDGPDWAFRAEIARLSAAWNEGLAKAYAKAEADGLIDPPAPAFPTEDTK